ncbi:MAG: hypothetical protein U0572_09815 [Phycisphaerales bacterium]
MYTAISTDDGLREKVDEAKELFVDRLEEKATELALNGDGKLLVELLRANRPEKYGWRGVRVDTGRSPAQQPAGDASRGLELINAWERECGGVESARSATRA